jgi:hypothetical protein
VLAASHTFEVSRRLFLVHRATGDRSVGVDLGVPSPDTREDGVEFLCSLAGTQTDGLVLQNAA